MAYLIASWTKVADNESLQRSSHCVSAVASKTFVWGGELRPREPRDNHVQVIDIQDDPAGCACATIESTSSSPPPRVGSACSELNGNIYFFSGRGGVAMSAIEEHGALWCFHPSTFHWTLISPADPSLPYPPGRSYHAMASNGSDTLYVHAGCPEKGRMSDLWAFHVPERKWTQLSASPPPDRGGPSMAFSDGLLYRMNGFDGKSEQGGHVDVYDPETNSWSSMVYAPDGIDGPEARSVACLLPVDIEGTTALLTMFGERDPSALGHQGAGRMLNDVWAFDIKARSWRQVRQGEKGSPPARGWFDASVVKRAGPNIVVVQGGLAESNDRLGDVWRLTVSRSTIRS